VPLADLLTSLTQQPGCLENCIADFSGDVMTVHAYSLSAVSLIASGFAGVSLDHVRKTTAMLGRHGHVSLY